MNAAISRFKLAHHRFGAEQAPVDPGACSRDIDEVRHGGAEYASAMARGELARMLRISGDLAGALAQSERAVADLTRLGADQSISTVRVERAAVLLATGDFDGAEREARAGIASSAGEKSSDDERRKAAAVETLVALASGHPSRAMSALDRYTASSILPSGSADEHLAVVAEGLLVAEPEDARRVFVRLDALLSRLPLSNRLAPRASVACARQILGMRADAGDDELVRAALASHFLRENHLVVRVAALWAEAERLRREGDSASSAASFAEAIERASAAGHVGLVDALRRNSDRA